MPVNSQFLQDVQKYAAKEAVKSALSSRFPDIKQGLNLPTWASGITTGINAGQNLMSPGAYNYASNKLRSVKEQPNLSLLEGAKRIAAIEAANRMVTDAFKGNFKPPVQNLNTGGGTGLGPGVVPIVLGTRDGVTADPTQSDQYRAELSRYMNTVAGPSKEQLGLQIWAQSNPGLAAKLKSGQPGYDQSADYFSNRYRDYGDMPSTGVIGTLPLEGQQPVQIEQPEMEGIAPESTNEKVQNFLRMLTEVGQGK